MGDVSEGRECGSIFLSTEVMEQEAIDQDVHALSVREQVYVQVG